MVLLPTAASTLHLLPRHRRLRHLPLPPRRRLRHGHRPAPREDDDNAREEPMICAGAPPSLREEMKPKSLPFIAIEHKRFAYERIWVCVVVAVYWRSAIVMPMVSLCCHNTCNDTESMQASTR